MASGIEVNPEITELYNDMKLRKTHKYMIFYIKDKKSIELEVEGAAIKTSTKEECGEQFANLCAHLKDEARYVLYDFRFAIANGRVINKLAFIFWSPDEGKIGSKMIYASSKDSLKQMFTGIGVEFQANDRSDLSYEDFAAEIEKKA